MNQLGKYIYFGIEFNEIYFDRIFMSFPKLLFDYISWELLDGY